MADSKQQVLSQEVVYSGKGISVRLLEETINSERQRQNVEIEDLNSMREKNLEIAAGADPGDGQVEGAVGPAQSRAEEAPAAQERALQPPLVQERARQSTVHRGAAPQPVRDELASAQAGHRVRRPARGVQGGALRRDRAAQSEDHRFGRERGDRRGLRPKPQAPQGRNRGQPGSRRPVLCRWPPPATRARPCEAQAGRAHHQARALQHRRGATREAPDEYSTARRNDRQPPKRHHPICRRCEREARPDRGARSRPSAPLPTRLW